ncbi:glutaredoxin family protein [Zymobacter palmae]|uniref:Glutaredoxin and related proteins n=1 Tax=Zymobacter palmae TaxID=33074 RepID=A0A348HB48_9GAMM|nr:glutaredoxin [Zymobacter palmae]BBG28850.1 glutaredoxin and related proteins [Zymobacter palmae]
MRNLFRLISAGMMLGMAWLATPAMAATPVTHDAKVQTAPIAKDAPLVLYYRDDCPYCWNVMSYLNDQHRELPMKEINSSEAISNELIIGGGKRQVPCLRIRENNGNKITWLYQSAEIIKYLDEHPQP